ncbi:MAG: hypothetical protein ACYCZ7_00620 [Minisyncoccota bacterium]
MKSFNKTGILLTSALLLTVALIGAYIFFFVATKDKTSATAELSLKNETLAGKESRVAVATTALKAESANIEKLSAYFIEEGDIVAFTKKIELLGAQSGVKLSLEALDPGIGEGGAPVLDFRIVATGEFQNVMRLLGLLENFPAKFAWKSVALFLSEEGVSPNPKIKAPKAQWKAAISLSALNYMAQ